MGALLAATRAELKADYRRAIRYYRTLAAHGTPLDRVGIYQAIARCHEKLRELKKAGVLHEKAGRGYLSVSNKVMGKPERTYYAMMEFRAALQDYQTGDGMRKAAAEYLSALSNCLKGGAEGYSHEMLFAGLLCTELGFHRKASKMLRECGKQLESAKEKQLAREVFALASAEFQKTRR